MLSLRPGERKWLLGAAILGLMLALSPGTLAALAVGTAAGYRGHDWLERLERSVMK